MTDAPQPTDPFEQQRAERESSRLSYRDHLPESWREDFDRLSRRMQPQAAAAIVRDRIRRRTIEAALPVADAVVANIRNRY